MTLEAGARRCIWTLVTITPLQGPAIGFYS
jgi:hypothetical protein